MSGDRVNIMKLFSKTDIGLMRESNQDRFFIKKYENNSVLFAVADGVGGYSGGDIAAENTIKILEGFNPDNVSDGAADRLCDLIALAHRKICDMADKNSSLKNMGTTLAMGWILGKRLYWAYVGDTRIYLFRKGTLSPLTRDHTIPGLLLKEGEITREQARNHPMSHGILKCIGGRDAKPDTGECSLMNGDILFACSDGLHGMVRDEKMTQIMLQEKNPDRMVEALVYLALKSGGDDNITIAGVQL